MQVHFDRYYRYDELLALLRHWAERYPNLCRLEMLGQSYEGRGIPLLTLTQMDTGPDHEKPAYWVDGNIHATEVSASTAALYLIHKLLTQYGHDPRVTYALDSRVFYVVPRLNPDGAEWALADHPRYIRSSTRPYPRQDQLDGLIPEDIDGDGRLLQMRLKDPHGNWKVHPDEPRLMVRRAPDDLPNGDYYRLLPEGKIQNYDGVLIKVAPSQQGLDLNRNFPVNWSPSQSGAGDFPTAEPEVRAAVAFIAAHRNITGSVSFHTFSGVHLRPPTKGPDSDLPTSDLHTYKKIGERGEALTGYPAVSVYHDFAYNPKDYIKGTFDDWMYEHLGVYAWTTEIWSVQRQAGLKDYKYIDWFREHPVEHDLQIIRWFDEHLGGEGLVPWYAFEHPQLGTVELGGWNSFITWRNPPYALLEQEIAPLAEFCLANCLMSPRLELHSATVQTQGDVHYVRVVVHNTGWLPTNISQQAVQMKAVKPVEVDIQLPEGVRLLLGEARQFAGQLAGRDHMEAFSMWRADETNNRLKLEWVVQGPAGAEVDVTIQHERAGVVRTRLALG